MNTAAAALQAHVTADTVRTWCRRGVVAAVKQAGRWIIDTASLAHRIAIGARRKPVTDPNPTPGTMAARGQDYVATWPANIARKFHLSPAYVAEALVRAGHATAADQATLGQTFLRSEFASEVGALTSDTAKSVIAELRAISDEINQAAKTNCHYCGLKLRADGECNSCGTGA